MGQTFTTGTDSSFDDIRALALEEAASQGVDPELITRVIAAESAWNPRARSRVGALGLMQLMPDTARELGVVDPFDARQNVRGGVRHLKRLLERYSGDRELALAAYNAGEGNVQKYGGVPPFQETRDYVAKILTDFPGPSPRVTSTISDVRVAEPQATPSSPFSAASASAETAHARPVADRTPAAGVGDPYLGLPELREDVPIAPMRSSPGVAFPALIDAVSSSQRRPVPIVTTNEVARLGQPVAGPQYASLQRVTMNDDALSATPARASGRTVLTRAEFEAAYDEIAPQIAESAPPGLSREQFDDLVLHEIEQRSAAVGGNRPSLVNRAIPAAMRIGGTIAGGLLGSAFPGPGTLIGGGIGAGVGEMGAQRYEQLTEQRGDINPTQLAVQTGLGAIPMGRVAGSTIGQIAGRRALQGSGMGAFAAGATEMAETGELPSIGTVGAGAALGTALGGGFGSLEGRALQRAGRLDLPAVPVHEPAGLLPPGATYIGTAGGRVARTGTDIPMMPAEDGSYVRSVPGEYARREVRGLLPAGPRFVADAQGNAVAVEQADELGRVAQGQARPGESFARGVPAAVIARDIDPSQIGAQGLRVRQFSGDVNASSAPLVDDDARRLLEDAAEDLREQTPERGRLVKRSFDEPDSIYARGAAGTPIADDIRKISGTRPDNNSIRRALDHLLEGRPATNKLHVAWLDWVDGVRRGDPSYHAPVVGPAKARWAAEDAARGADDDFDAFARSVDDVESRPSASSSGRDPGEEGFIRAGLLMRGGGALAGGALGATQGDTPQERLENALLYGAAGAAAPLLLRRLSSPQPTAGRRVINMSQLRRVGSSPTPEARATGLNPPGSQRVQGTPRTNPMAGTDAFLDKFGGSNPLLREGVRERLIEHGGFDVQRRGRLDVETQGRLAEAVRIDVERVLPRGSALNAEAIAAYTRAVKSTSDRVRELSARMASGQATDTDVIALHAAKADADVVLKSLMGARSEAGRALAMFRAFSALLETGDVNLYRRAAHGLRDDAAELAGRVAQIADPLEQYRFLQSQGRPTLGDKFRSYYYSSILSGIKSHERNILGNAFSLLTRFAATPIAAGLDAAKVAVRGGQRQVYAGEMQPAAVGAVVGLEKGIKALAFTLRHGVSPDALRRSVTAAVEHGQFDVPRVEFGGGRSNPFNWPGRALDAADAFFRAMARDTELYASAWARATREGLSGERLVARAADLRTDAAFQVAAQQFAVESVFQQKPGPITGALQAAVRAIPGGFFVLPFLKTPSNLLRAGAQASPIGFVTKAGRAEGRVGAQAQGLAALGTMMLAPLAWLAATNRLSGSGPSDRAERAALMESGWRPNSVRIGDQWMEYTLVQPISTQAAAIANAYEAWRQAGTKEEDAIGIATQIVARFGRSVLEQSYLSGLYDFLSALESPERFAAQWAGRSAHSMTPFAGAQRTVAQVVDPVVRSPKTAGDVFASSVPGLSRRLEPRLDRFGGEVRRPGGARSAFDALNVSPVVRDDVAEELNRLGVRLSLPSDRITIPGGAALTADQGMDLRRTKGQQLHDVLSRVIANPNYQRLPEALRRNALEKVIRASNRNANDRMRADAMRGLRREALLRQLQGEQ